jgi:hypothetical protein
MEIICINDKFSPEWEAYFLLNSIKTPVADKLYTIRGVVPNTVGETGILLNEVVNKLVPKVSPVTGFKGMAEQNWAISRFTDLQGMPLSKEAISELTKVIISYDRK